MANEVHAPPEPGFTDLVKGIINDFGALIRQEIRFARTEIKADLAKTREAATVLALGVGTSVLGVVLLALMLVYLLHWLSYVEGAADPGRIPLWGCFGIVSAIFLVSGVALMAAGRKMFQNFNPLPDQTAQTVKENVEWIVNSK
jgi:hypothetical protein